MKPIGYATNGAALAVLGTGGVSIGVFGVSSEEYGLGHLIEVSCLETPLRPGDSIPEGMKEEPWVNLLILNLEGLAILEGACAVIRQRLLVFSQVGFDEWEFEEATP